MKKYKERTGFTRVQNSLIDTWAQILSPQVTMVYICIISHVNSKTQVGFPSYATIAHKCGMHRVSAIDAVADLVFLEFIAKKACWHKDGDQDSNNYYVLDLPDINDVMVKFLDNEVKVPKKREWIIKNLKRFRDENFKKREYEKLVEERNTGHNKGGVVVIDYHPSSVGLPPVVVTDYHGGSVGLPKQDISKQTYSKHTYLHTGESENESQATSLDSTEKGVASDKPVEGALVWVGSFGEEEKKFIKVELAKLNDHSLAQHVLDEVLMKYTAGKVRTSLAVYTKGLVNKANKGEFAPTNNLQLKRAQKAQQAITAKNNIPPTTTTKNVDSSAVVANIKQIIAGGGGRRLKKTPEEQAEIDKALAEIARRSKPVDQ